MALTTPITELFGIRHPIMLASMAGAAGPGLAAAVTNAGGLGNIGGIGFFPDALRKTIQTLKDELFDRNAPFGVDVLLPQLGEGAEKTHHGHARGILAGLIDVIIAEKAALLICSVGVPPKWAVDKLHEANIPVMSMIGAVKHVGRSLEAGVDIICAQGGGGGGHAGEVATSILLPNVVDLCRGKTSPLTGGPILVVGAGGISDGRGLAMALAAGCSGVLVGAPLIASEEVGAEPMLEQRDVEANYEDTHRTIMYSGRPMPISKAPYSVEMEEHRQDVVRTMSASGIPACIADMEASNVKGASLPPAGMLSFSEVRTQDEIKSGVVLSEKEQHARGAILIGQCDCTEEGIKPAKDIIEEMVSSAAEIFRSSHHLRSRL